MRQFLVQKLIFLHFVFNNDIQNRAKNGFIVITITHAKILNKIL